MEPADAHDEEQDLTAPGRRWGRGADSVLPYLTRSLQSRPTGSLDGPGDERRPARSARNEPPSPGAMK